MKKYLAPVAELISFSATDVILTSPDVCLDECAEDGPPIDSGTDMGGTVSYNLKTPV